MADPAHIRYGLQDKIGSKRLAALFNETMSETVSFNYIFPKLMTRFIADHPQYGIVKKTMTAGVTYLRIGAVADPQPKEHHPTITTKEKNDRARGRKIQKAGDVMDAICNIKGWQQHEYQQMVDLRLIDIIKINGTINIEATIRVSEALLIKYLQTVFYNLKSAANDANIVKEDFERAVRADINLTIINFAPRYDDRLLATTRTYSSGVKLQQELTKYSGTVPGLPILNYIVYPDIQHLHELSTWLRSRSEKKIRISMGREYRIYENAEDVDEDENTGENEVDDDTIDPEFIDGEIHMATVFTSSMI